MPSEPEPLENLAEMFSFGTSPSFATGFADWKERYGRQFGRLWTGCKSAGTLIEDARALDVAWVHGEFERSNPSGTWTEDWSTNRIYATATFRF